MKPTNQNSGAVTFVDAATAAALKTGADPKEIIHAAFSIKDGAEPPHVETPPPDPHRVIAYQFIRLLTEGAQNTEEVNNAVALLHASGEWSVTELIGYHPPHGKGLYDPGPLAEYLLDVTAVNRLTPPPAGFELNLHTLHRVLSMPPKPNREDGNPPAPCCASCGQSFEPRSPIKNLPVYRCYAHDVRRYRVVDSRDPAHSDWLCYACQGRSDDQGRSLPFEPHSSCIREDGTLNGHMAWFKGMALNGVRFGHGREWLRKLGYSAIESSPGIFVWRRPVATSGS